MSHGKKFKSPSYREVSQMILNENDLLNPPDLKVKLLFKDAKVPQRSYATDSGLDVFAYRFERLYRGKGCFKSEELDTLIVEKTLNLLPSDRVLINTGISCTVGPCFEIQVRPRSGLALKQGITVCNTPGTIDESYRGMLGVILLNTSSTEQSIELGTRIAQIVVCPVMLSSIKIVSELGSTDRNEGGFQSTGL